MRELGISVSMTPLGMRNMRVTIPAMKTLAKARAILRFASECYDQDAKDAFANVDYLLAKIASERGEDLSSFDSYLEADNGNEQVSADDSRGQAAVEDGAGTADGDEVLDPPPEDDEVPM